MEPKALLQQRVMASKAIYEADAKALIYKFISSKHLIRNELLKVDEGNAIEKEDQWLLNKGKRIIIITFRPLDRLT